MIEPSSLLLGMPIPRGVHPMPMHRGEEQRGPKPSLLCSDLALLSGECWCRRYQREALSAQLLSFLGVAFGCAECELCAGEACAVYAVRGALADDRAGGAQERSVGCRHDVM